MSDDERGIWAPDHVFKSLLASGESDKFVMRFLEKQAECIAVTTRLTLMNEVSELDKLADKVADVWILATLMLHIFPALDIKGHITSKLEAQLEGVPIPGQERH